MSADTAKIMERLDTLERLLVLLLSMRGDYNVPTAFRHHLDHPELSREDTSS